jgi:chemotaxis signal transduction protein
MESVVIPVGADLYAVPVDWVREVVAAPLLTQLVTAPPVVLGLFNLRGDIVPLLDTAALLGLGRVDGAPFAVVLRHEQGLAGLAATAFPRRAQLDTPSGLSELTGAAGIYKVGEQVVVLLDPDALLTPDRLGGADAFRGRPHAGVT